METKLCGKCRKEKPVSDFYKERRSKDGLASRCKECTQSAVKEWYTSNPEHRERAKRKAVAWNKKNGRKVFLRRRYGMTIEQHEHMYQDQDGCCLLCERPIPYSEIHTDHNHKTGKVRGLLCRECNYFIGKLEMYPHLLNDAFEYLGWKNAGG